MKHILPITLLFLSLSASAATSSYSMRPNSSSSGDNLGLGIMLGEPSGLTGKYWLSQTDAVDLNLSYSFNDYGAISSDYLKHFPNLFSSIRGDLNGEFIPFVGVGGVIFVSSGSTSTNQHFFTGDSGNNAAFGLRIPLGVEFLPRKNPFGVYAEIDPGVGVLPSTFGFIGGEIGARFYF